jgi:hypothetical protein
MLRTNGPAAAGWTPPDLARAICGRCERARHRVVMDGYAVWSTVRRDIPGIAGTPDNAETSSDCALTACTLPRLHNGACWAAQIDRYGAPAAVIAVTVAVSSASHPATPARTGAAQGIILSAPGCACFTAHSLIQQQTPNLR